MLVDISAILYAPGGAQTVAKTISYLQKQTGPAIELVLVVPLGEADSVEAYPPLTVTVLEVDPRTSTADAWSQGARQASAPIVAFTEDHAFPQPGWAEALVETHKEPWYAVGPAVENANPRSPISRADMFMNFLNQFRSPEGPADSLLGHNTSYKREVLSRMTVQELQAALRSESVLHLRWGRQHCFHQPRACVHHVNISLPRPFALHKLLGGIIFGGERCRHWSRARRLVYLCGSWAIPFLRAGKIWKKLSSLGQTPKGPVIPWLVLALILHATGEALGYVGGPRLARLAYGNYSVFEKRRWEMVSEEDRVLRETAATK